MAKYQPTIEIWAITDQIRSGKIKLQRGQWITCGGLPRSRFVGVNLQTGTIDAVHGGTGKEVTDKFLRRCQIKRETVARFGKE